MKRETYALIFASIFVAFIVMTTNNALGDYRIEAALIEARSMQLRPKQPRTVVLPTSTPSLTTTFGVNTKNVNTTDIFVLQRFLSNNGFLAEKYITGEFGPRTQQAVRDFQKANAIDPATGFVGELTLQKINAMLSAGY